MPESFGKRARGDVNARKAAAREARRVARNKRREARAAGLLEPGPPLAEPEDPFEPAPSESDVEG